MKKLSTLQSKIIIASILIALISSFHMTMAQNEENQAISVYQYRKVDPGKMNELLERETKYWSQVAQKAVDEGKLYFWAVFQKVGGYDLDNSSDILFVNTFPDIDNIGGIWDPKAVFPDVPMEEMETYSMSKNTSMIFVKSHYWEQAADANPEEDFKYVKFVYHNANNPGGLIEAENEVWAPFIKSAMDQGKTSQKAWGNARVLSPTGEEIKYNTISFDVYPSLKEALDPTWSEDLQAPDMTKIGEAEGNRRASVVYRIVKVVNAGQ
jgi:hypothetical protein